VLDSATLAVLTNLALFDPTPAAIKIGRKHLYDTRRTSGLGHVSCGSCHVDARFDRLAWDLGNPAGEMVTTIDERTFHPMKGPMVTQTLQDMRTPLHWRADRNTLEDFNVTFTDLLGADAMLSTNEMKEFKDFLATTYFAPNRFRNFDNSLSTNLPLPGHYGTTPGWALGRNPLPSGNAEAGRKVFEQRFFHVGAIGQTEPTQRCDLCHNGDSGFGVEGGPNLRLFRNNGLPFKGAQLRNLPDKVGMDRVGTSSRAGFGFMHDGRADTLTRVVVDGLGIGRNEESAGHPDQDIADMVAFLLCFTGGGTGTGSDGDHDSLDTPAAVGRQVTITSKTTNSLFQAMLAQADAGSGVDLIARGSGRNWFYDRNSGRFQSDRNVEDISVDALLALAGADNSITFTVTPIGTGARIAVDRDEDGYLDRTEVDYGLDPFDSQSRGGNTPPRLNPGWPFFDTLPQVKVHPGMALTITNITATDTDLPPQTLTFSLTDDAPPGATINPTNGLFSWTPPLSEPPGERRIAVRVSDDGFPGLDRIARLSVTIVPLRANWIYRGRISGDVLIQWDRVEDAHYGVQYKDRLDDVLWTELAGAIFLIPAGGAQAGDYTATNTMQRFYRILLRE
jgi:hypothetical protein